MVEKSMNDLLESEPAIQRFFGGDFVFYLRTVLCDPRGQNLRNGLSHGLMGPDEFHRGVSDRLMHILWTLGFVQKKDTA
jgi:hypothetical protein